MEFKFQRQLTLGQETEVGNAVVLGTAQARHDENNIESNSNVLQIEQDSGLHSWLLKQERDGK